MTRLILTADSSSAAGPSADLAVPIELRMVWGPPRSDAELAAIFDGKDESAARTSTARFDAAAAPRKISASMNSD